MAVTEESGKKMSFISTFELVQQTPMIHFQHDEEGATLRASEVKPKLDRFIIGWLKKNTKRIPASWFVECDSHGKPVHESLKFKLRFEVKGAPLICGKDDKGIPIIHKSFFGNQGKESGEFIKTVFYRESIAAKIVCMCSEKVTFNNTVEGLGTKAALPEVLGHFLPVFFAMHTFGTRGRRGFGSFTVKDSVVTPEMLLGFCPLLYYVEYAAVPDHNAVMNDVWVIAGMMKSGFNFTFSNLNDYYKGRIFRYFTNKNIGSDKAFIKKRVLTAGRDSNQSSEENIDYREYRFSRAMLGLAQNYEFRPGNRTTRRGTVTIAHEPRGDQQKIGRFPCPVLFKPHGKYLFMIPNEIPDEMYDTDFKFNNSPITTPAKDEFNLEEYLDWFVAEYNDKTDIESFANPAVRSTINRNLNIVKLAERGRA